MANSDEETKLAGTAALSICQSLLIALCDLKVFSDKEAQAVLEDAATTHLSAAPGSANYEHHRAVGALINRILEGKDPIR